MSLLRCGLEASTVERAPDDRSQCWHAHKGCLAGMQAARSILERTGKEQAGVQLLSPCSAC